MADRAWPVDFGGPVERSFEPFPEAALEGSVLDSFDRSVHRFADRLAVADLAGELTYAQLAAMADRIAAAIVTALGERDGPIAILLGREVRYVAAMLGALAAGRGYIPLDNSDPVARSRLIAIGSGAAAIVSAGDSLAQAARLFPAQLPVIDLDRLVDAPILRRKRRLGPTEIASIHYTSGSTGAPKGAVHNHRNLLHDAMQQINTLHVTPDDRIGMPHSPTAIGATREILAALFSGASVHLLPPRELLAAGLVREIRARRITLLRLVPPLMRQIADVLGGVRLDSVRIFGTGSQRIDWADVDVFRRVARPDARLIVGIGATECGGNFAHWFVDERFRGPGALLPIGRVLPDAAVTVVDDDENPVTDGETGEFVVASRYVALGYWRDPEQTARAFATDAEDPTVRRYRTGDFGRRRLDGLLEFVGRKDDMIKLRGHRIELAEIEAGLLAIPGIRDVAIVIRRTQAELPRSLIAYVECCDHTGPSRSHELRGRLAERLPRYMVPASIVAMPALPRLPNLKIDRAELAAIDAERRAAAPENDPLLADVLAIFEQVIGGQEATPEDNVASLGGDSLQAVIVAVAIEKHFSVALPAGLFDEVDTIRDLARWLAGRLRRSAAAD